MSNFHGGVILPSAKGRLTALPFPGDSGNALDPSSADHAILPFGVRTGKTLAEADPGLLLEEIRATGIVEADGRPLAEHIEKAMERSAAGKLRFAAVSLLEPDPASLSLSSLAVDFADAIAGGLAILLKLLSVREGSILCDKDRPEAVDAIRAACEESRLIAVEILENRYPLAHPKLITRWLCQKELSAGSSPEAAGLFLIDAESCIALHSYFSTGEPRSSVRTTLWENGEGRVYDLPLGLPVAALIEAGLFETLSPSSVVSADTDASVESDAPAVAAPESASVPLRRGVMDGRPAPDAVDRSLAVLTPAVAAPERAGDCIRCGACSRVCPMFLQPYRYLPEKPWIARLSGAPRDAVSCIGCGCCSFVCPAELPLRHYALEARERESVRLRDRDDARKKGAN
ncbi:MAG: hypothetical protein IJX76_08275 [Clostridia bacterium]|nr:hypothetical protein [Clostridia bacterium]